MKKMILTALSVCVFGGMTMAQEQRSEVELDSFEQCNNWARHYCTTANHNNAVNQRLLQLKKRGYIITTSLIRSYAQRTRPDTPVQQRQN